jgi:hypothetical protein
MKDIEERIEILEKAIENLMIVINNLHKVDEKLNEKIELLK